MAAQSTVLKYSPLKSFDSASLTSGYQAIGTPVGFQARIFKIVNNSNVAVLITTDTSEDEDVLPAGTFCLYDVGTNRGSPSPELCLQNNTQFYVKQVTGAGTGLIYVVTLYAYTPSQTIPL